MKNININTQEIETLGNITTSLYTTAYIRGVYKLDMTALLSGKISGTHEEEGKKLLKILEGKSPWELVSMFRYAQNLLLDAQTINDKRPVVSKWGRLCEFIAYQLCAKKPDDDREINDYLYDITDGDKYLVQNICKYIEILEDWF